MNNIITQILVLCLMVIKTQSAFSQWTSIDFYPEGSAYSCASFVIGDKAYVGGGNTSKKSFYMLDLTTDKWTKLNDIPGGVNRASPIRFVIDGIGYIGCGGDQFKGSTNSFYAFDPKDNSWTRKANFGGGLKHSGFYVAAGGKGYVICGTDGTTAVADVWEYDPATDQWTQKADFPGGTVYWPTGFEIDGKIYVTTGTINGAEQKELYVYDPSEDSWSQKADFAGPLRGVAVGFSINGRGYIGGGVNEDFTGTHTDFWEYDPVSDSWSLAEHLEFPIPNTGWSTAFVYNSFVYMGTGGRLSGFVRPTPQWRKINLYTAPSFSNTELTQVTCRDGRDGAIDISIEGGLPPFTFNWSSGQTTEDVSGLPEGVYSVEVTDAAGTVLASPEFTIDHDYYVDIDGATVTTEACGKGDGMIVIEASTNSQNLIYSWSHDPGLNASTASDLKAGTYQVMVTNEFGCTATSSHEVISTEGPEVTLGALTQPDCKGNDAGAIEIVVSGGHGNIEILWTGPDGYESNDASIGNLNEGAYSVLVRDERGCETTADYSIVLPELPQGDVEVNNTNAGESAGSIAVSNVTGGVAPYTFTLYDENAAELSQNFTGVFDSLGLGIYSVEVKDADECATLYTDLSIILTSDIPHQEEIGVTAYPNPVSDRVIIESDHLTNGECSIRITDLLGKVMYNRQVFSGKPQIEIDMSGYGSGIYLLTLSAKNVKRTISLVR